MKDRKLWIILAAILALILIFLLWPKDQLQSPDPSDTQQGSASGQEDPLPEPSDHTLPSQSTPSLSVHTLPDDPPEPTIPIPPQPSGETDVM